MGARKPKFVEQVHEEVIRHVNGFGTPCAWVEVHTYEAGSELALLDVHGSDMDDEESTVGLWVNPGEVVALRDALNQMLGEA